MMKYNPWGNALHCLPDREADLCASHPCENNGSCMVLDDKYVCMCVDHYNGQHCEKRTSELKINWLYMHLRYHTYGTV